MPDTNAVATQSAGGFALVELFVGATVLIVSSLALLSSLFTSARVGRDARFRTLARNESLTVIEEFRNQCAAGFAIAVDSYAGREITCNSIAGGKSSSTVRTDIALNETVLSPPMDLNGDGDALDAALTGNELALVCMTTTVSWQSGRQVDTYATVLARVDVAAIGDQSPGAPSAGPTSPSPTGPPSPPEPTQITLDSFDLGKSSLSAALTTSEALDVAGMTIHSSVGAYVKDIKVNGKTVFKVKDDMPPTGQMIVTQPFTMPAGTQTIDHVTFAGGPSGGKVNVGSSSMSIVFHTESGDRVVVIE